MNFLRRLADKVFARFVDLLLHKVDERLLHPRRLLHLDAQKEAADYAQRHMQDALIVNGYRDILAIALERMPDQGNILEFGVGGGESIRWIAGNTRRQVIGFDSFEGLPEDWHGRHEGKGHYSTHGSLPAVPTNVTLIKGWFNETLPDFLETNQDPVALLHVDCDLYSSTKTVLDSLASRIVPETVIVFDEYFNFISWRQHEYRAFQEFVAETGVKYRYVCWAYQQVMVIIE